MARPTRSARAGLERRHGQLGANFVVTVSSLTLLTAIDGVGVFFLFGGGHASGSR
jgi:hypothetical protein